MQDLAPGVSKRTSMISSGSLRKLACRGGKLFSLRRWISYCFFLVRYEYSFCSKFKVCAN